MSITYVCPQCNKPVTWTRIELSGGHCIAALDWDCRYCGAEVITWEAIQSDEQD